MQHKLKSYRKKSGLTLEEVSKELGYSTPNGYWKIEKGITKLKADQLIKLIKILDISLSQIEKEIECNV